MTEPQLQRTVQSFPASAFMLASKGVTVEMSKGGDGGPRRFRVNYNTGKPMPHALFGTLSVDLDSLEVPGRAGVLLQHDPRTRIGVADKLTRDEKTGMWAEGAMLSNEDAQRVVADFDDNFPWEFSPKVPPKEIQFLSEGESAVVNGHKVEGPAAIFRGSRLRELSFVTNGQDPDTSGELLSEDETQVSVEVLQTMAANNNAGGDNTPATPQTVDELRAGFPALVDLIDQQHTSALAEATAQATTQATEAATTAERERVSAILSESSENACDPAVALECIKDGLSLEDSLRKLIKSARSGAAAELAALHDDGDGVGSGDGNTGDDGGEKPWEKLSEAERGEFMNDKDLYEAYLRAPVRAPAKKEQ